MLLEVIGSFIAGLFHRLGQQTGNVLTDSKQQSLKNAATNLDSNSDITDLEIWNVVTSYGKYKEVWPIYRTSGLLEAIKVRDEKADFDLRMSEIKDTNQLQKPSTQQNIPPRRAPQKITREIPQNFKVTSRKIRKERKSTIFHNNQNRLEDLDLALVRGLVSYFEVMPDKIRHYRRDHNASEEEAEIIASYYEKTAGIIRNVTTQDDLKDLVEHLENLKRKVERYKHESYKYRLSTGLKKEVIKKLEKIL